MFKAEGDSTTAISCSVCLQIGTLSRFASSSKEIAFMTCECLKLLRGKPASKTFMTQIENVFLDFCVGLSSMFVYTLADNGATFTCEQFALLCTMLGVKNLLKTMYQPQVNRRVKRWVCMNVTRQQHRAIESKKEWYKQVHSLAYTYNTPAHKTTNTTSSSFVLMQHLPGPAGVSKLSRFKWGSLVEVEPARLRYSLPRKIHESENKFNLHMWWIGLQYKHSAGTEVRFDAKFIPSQ